MIWVLALVALPLPSNAEIERRAYRTDTGLKLMWWPKLQIPKGWVRDEAASRNMELNILVPKGKPFENAPTVICGRAINDPSRKVFRDLNSFVSSDIAEIRKEKPGVKVQELAPVKTKGGVKLRVFSFVTPQAYERVAFGEEGNFWLVFTITSQSAAGLKRELPRFSDVLKRYR